MDSIIYGPVPSWRLGRSLGIDLVSTEGKTCSFDCVYCQLGKTIHRVNQRKEFVSLEKLAAELAQVKGVGVDCVTFSGVAEPTLASNLGQAIDLAKTVFDLPIVVLTNSSMMFQADVRSELAHADVVVAKLDSADEHLFRSINRPVEGISFEQTLAGIQQFRQEFSGVLALQMMFIKANRNSALALAALAAEISPDEVQINTPLRPCAVKPLEHQSLIEISNAFDSFKGRVMMVLDSTKSPSAPLNMEETLKRRPQL